MEMPVTLRPGTLVTIAFPFTDLSAVKRRPALVLISAGADIVLCGVTSQLSRRRDAVRLEQRDMMDGRLPRRSEIRPLKLFTIHRSLLHHVVGRVKKGTLAAVVQVITTSLAAGVG